ncbi:type II toxin-antitoxin system HicA family toxin [Luteolibacter sp. Populi]|uniref:type II toxin-antitoxin system HicA family toxin n=1 Tax=Luteolibacter sp. Populi TaxID=3230487 RepID=UPI0034666D0E
MKLPRDLDGAELIRALKVLGYEVSRQKGSHVRVTTSDGGKHHETIPLHRPLKAGTLAGLLKSLAAHHQISVAELIRLLDL